MLSIGKLAVGQANYYLEQAGGRIDRGASVASGVEDYYAGGAEPSGEWIGSGIAGLGLRGDVAGDALHRVLSGEQPVSGEPLRASHRVRVPGFDLTFSAPKSISVLFGVGEDGLRTAIQGGHDVAVRDAIGYIERMCSIARRGHDGVTELDGDGLIAAAFRHRTSRAGDPQLHTHVLVANLVRGADGRWSAIDGRRLYAHAKTAGYIYEARLRAELTKRLGVEWTAVSNGIADVVGVPKPVLRAFSRRRHEIEREMARRGVSSAAAAQVAVLETRRTKDRLVDPRQLESEWRERAAALGFDATRLRGVLNRQVAPEHEVESVRAVADELAGPEGLTCHVSSFTRRDVIRAWCERLPPGSAVSSRLVENLADRFLASPRAVPLLDTRRPPPDAMRMRDGHVAPLIRDELRYSTPELLAIEQRIVDGAVDSATAPAGIAEATAADSALACRQFLSDEQQVMVQRLTRVGGQVVAVVGKAGTGKTTALAAAREAWEASGIRVIGAAVARRAARELQESAGIESTSLAALLTTLRRGGRYALAPRGVVVLDEASMVSSRDLAELVDHVVAVGGKLVLCGDHRQLPSIRAGGAFRAVAARTDAIQLSANRRQREQWERAALDELRDGSSAEAIRAYEAHDRLVLGGERVELMRRLVSDWWTSPVRGERLMIALRRADVRELNLHARVLMREAGLLGGDVLLPCGTFAAGDRVVLRRNDRRLGVANGEFGVVRRIDRTGSLVVDIGRRRVVLPRSYVERSGRRPPLQHAYAVTGHVAQGMTVDAAFVLGSPELYREWGYTAMSRGRRTNRLYVLDPEDVERRDIAPRPGERERSADVMARGLATSRAHVTAIDTARAQRVRRSSSAELRRRAAALRVQHANKDRADPNAAELPAELSCIEEELARRAALERSIPVADDERAKER